jgi:hypothetical protein
MKTDIHLLSYLAQFFLYWKMFRITTVLEAIKTHILCSVTFLFENHAVCEVMLKNTVDPGRAQITIWRMRIASWITKATNTHSECVIHIPFPMNKNFKNSSQYYVIRTLPVLFSVLLSPPTNRPFPFPPKKKVDFMCILNLLSPSV